MKSFIRTITIDNSDDRIRSSQESPVDAEAEEMIVGYLDRMLDDTKRSEAMLQDHECDEMGRGPASKEWIERKREEIRADRRRIEEYIRRRKTFMDPEAPKASDAELQYIQDEFRTLQNLRSSPIRVAEAVYANGELALASLEQRDSCEWN